MSSARHPVNSVECVSVQTVAAAFLWVENWLAATSDQLARRATVICSTARAHALRRALAVEGAHAGRLAGVRFLDPAVCARELLARVGEVRDIGWEEVRRLRIHHRFASGEFGGSLRYFDADQLRSGRGYADAFARVIADLEDSGLDPALAQEAARELEPTDALAAGRLHDVATVWAAADADVGTRRSMAGLYVEAAAAVRRAPEIVTPFGPIAAFMTAAPSSALLQFLCALPECSVVFLDARPLRPGTQRWRAVLPALQAPHGAGTWEHDGAQDGGSGVTELALLRRFLFAPSEVVADPDRPRSAGPDGTVDVEEYPSIEDEIDAAALWVTEQIAAGTALEQIALIVPARDPHARLLLDRLARVGAPDASAIPAYIAAGLPLSDSPPGLRLGNLLRALARGLEAEATIAVLSWLCRDDQDEHRPLSPSRAAEIVYGAGIVGGSPGDVSGALEWLPRLLHRRDTLRRLLAEPPPSAAGEPEKRRHLLDRRDTERWLVDVEPLLPAIEALQQLATTVINEAPLRQIWKAIREFARRYLRMPAQPANWEAVLDEHIEGVLSDPISDTVRGFAAVTSLVEMLARARSHGRFGEPRVFIGTAESAAGLPFRAVRVLGLAEGIVPGTPHDDPIVPNDTRVRIEELLRPRHPLIVIPRLEDDVLEDLHAFSRIVAGTRARLALSVSRQWVDRSEREVSGVLLEVATALGRRLGISGDGDVPTAARLRSAYYGPALAVRRAMAERSLQSRAVLLHTPRRTQGGWRVPASWCAEGALCLDRLQSIAAAAIGHALTEIDGVVGAPWSAVRVPGLIAERPISASALTMLLQCPHRFLLQHVLHLDEPSGRPSTDIIDPRAYGSLFHAVAEAFFDAHGAAVCAREGTLDEWQGRAGQIAADTFDAWRAEYPLRGQDSIARECRRLVQQIAQLVEIEWRMPRRTFVDAEHSFGDPRPVRLTVPGGHLYVAGQIDRIDRSSSKLSVRDLKTGRVRDFREEPLNASRDLQIGLYTLALEADMPGTRVIHAAYVHPSAAQEPERRFEHSDLKALREQTRLWLGVARGLLTTGAFPRTPSASDCAYCPFAPACGEGAQARSEAKLATGPLSPELAAFVRVKEQERDDERQ